MTDDLAPLVLEKLREQVERLDHLLALIPHGALTSEEMPVRNAMALAMLLGHLLECLMSRATRSRSHIAEGLACLTDRDLTRAIPTVFEPSGVAVLTLPLGNLEHLTNHKHQVFLYLEMLGVPASGCPFYDIWCSSHGLAMFRRQGILEISYSKGVRRATFRSDGFGGGSLLERSSVLDSFRGSR